MQGHLHSTVPLAYFISSVPCVVEEIRPQGLGVGTEGGERGGQGQGGRSEEGDGSEDDDLVDHLRFFRSELFNLSTGQKPRQFRCSCPR